jgi:hypothetical protein
VLGEGERQKVRLGLRKVILSEDVCSLVYRTVLPSKVRVEEDLVKSEYL